MSDFLSKRIYLDYFLAFLAVMGLVVFLSMPEKQEISAFVSGAPEQAPVFPVLPDEISGKSAFVLDVLSGQVIFEKNAETQLPLASLTKVMTVLTAVENAPASAIIDIDKDALLAEGDSGLRVGDKWKLSDLAKIILTNSSNDGARAVASAVGALTSSSSTETKAEGRRSFVHLMNKKAEDLGLGQTYFINETGLDETGYLSGGYGSAKDVAFMMSALLRQYPEIFESTRKDRIRLVSELGLSYETKNTNAIVNDIPMILASKTGFTDLAGGNLALAFDAGFERPIVVVVLGSSQEDRFNDVKKLSEATLAFIQQGS